MSVSCRIIPATDFWLVKKPEITWIFDRLTHERRRRRRAQKSERLKFKNLLISPRLACCFSFFRFEGNTRFIERQSRQNEPHKLLPPGSWQSGATKSINIVHVFPWASTRMGGKVFNAMGLLRSSSCLLARAPKREWACVGTDEDNGDGRKEERKKSMTRDGIAFCELIVACSRGMRTKMRCRKRAPTVEHVENDSGLWRQRSSSRAGEGYKRALNIASFPTVYISPIRCLRLAR